MAATTAAAWATWRQIRDTDSSANQSDRAKEFAAHESSAAQVESAAMAAAAGAEQGADTSSTELPDEAKNIANIVESVMAELRPKIVAEISKKLAAEKK
jgi:guanyl-specific ribonuclease Sa